MAAWVEFVEEDDSYVGPSQPASGPGRRRLFLSSSGTQLKLVDDVGNITLLTSVFIQAIHNAIVSYTGVAYNAVDYETVKVLTQLADAGDIDIQLPTAIGKAGVPLKVLSVTPPFTGVLPAGRVVNVLPQAGQLINGQPSYQLTNAGENLNLEADGANWLIVG